MAMIPHICTVSVIWGCVSTLFWHRLSSTRRPHHRMNTHASSSARLPRRIVHLLDVWRGVRGEQGLRPPPWHSAAAPVMWRNMNHTSTPRLITYTCVNMLVAHRHTDQQTRITHKCGYTITCSRDWKINTITRVAVDWCNFGENLK